MDPFNAVATGISSSPSFIRSPQPGSRRPRTTCSIVRPEGTRGRQAISAEPRGRGSALLRRSGGGVRPVGHRPHGRDAIFHGWRRRGHYLNDSVNYTEPMFVVVIMAIAATRPVVGVRRGSAATGGGTWRGHAGGMVGRHPDGRPAARLVHHRTCGHDHLRAAARRASSTILNRAAAAVCDARPAVRERVDRRHPDPFRSAAGPDGGASVGLGHAVHAGAFRLASRAGDRDVDGCVLPGVPAAN